MESPIASAAAAALTSVGKASSYRLRWNTFSAHLTTGLTTMLEHDEFTDVILACHGQFIKAHKILLSLCSPFLKRLFKENELRKNNGSTIVILNNVRFRDLEYLIQFIYQGEVNVQQEDLDDFLKTAELLQIEGLAQPKEPCSRRNPPQPQPTHPVESNEELESFSETNSPTHSKRSRLSTPVSRLESILRDRSCVPDVPVHQVETITIKDEYNSNTGCADSRVLRPDEESVGGAVVEPAGSGLYHNQYSDVEQEHQGYENTMNTSVDFMEQLTSDDTSASASTGIVSGQQTTKGTKNMEDLLYSRNIQRCRDSLSVSQSSETNHPHPVRFPHHSITSTSQRRVPNLIELEVERGPPLDIESNEHKILGSIMGFERHHNPPPHPALLSILQRPTVVITEEEGRAQCPECLKFYKNRSSLKVHKSVYHRKGVNGNAIM